MIRSTFLPLMILAMTHAADCTAEEAPPSPACAAPVAFPEGGEKRPWRHKRNWLFTIRQGEAAHRGQDLLTVEGQKQWLIAKFAYGPADKDLEDEDVEIWIQRYAPCGSWELLATTRTTKDSAERTVEGVENDGGRVFFELPGSKRLPVGVHAVRMRVKGDFSHADFRVVILPKGASVVVFDVDGTLTTGDPELIKELAGDLIERRHVPQMRAGGPDAARAWANKGYLVLYLTGRPDLLHSITREWLVEKGFPPGVLHLTDTLRQAVPTDIGVAVYKTDFLRRLTDRGLTFAAAYGNAETDIRAYAAAGIATSRTFIAGKHGGKSGTKAVADYKTHTDDYVAVQPEAAVRAPRLSW